MLFLAGMYVRLLGLDSFACTGLPRISYVESCSITLSYRTVLLQHLYRVADPIRCAEDTPVRDQAGRTSALRQTISEGSCSCAIPLIADLKVPLLIVKLEYKNQPINVSRNDGVTTFARNGRDSPQRRPSALRECERLDSGNLNGWNGAIARANDRFLRVFESRCRDPSPDKTTGL